MNTHGQVAAVVLAGSALVAVAAAAAVWLCVPETVTLALIGAVTAITSIVGGLYTAQVTAAANADATRRVEARNLKRQHYHRFFEALADQLACKDLPAGEFKEAVNQHFCIEVNRLVLYASQEVVEWVERSRQRAEQSEATGQPGFDELFTLVRADLCDDTFVKFQSLDATTFHFQARSFAAKPTGPKRAAGPEENQ